MTGFTLKKIWDFWASCSLVVFMVFQVTDFDVWIGGLGAIYIGFAFLSVFFPGKKVYLRFGASELLLFVFCFSLYFSLFINVGRHESLTTAVIWIFGVLVSYYWGSSLVSWPKIFMFPGLLGAICLLVVVVVSMPSLDEFLSGFFFVGNLGEMINPNRFSVFLLISLVYIAIGYSFSSGSFGAGAGCFLIIVLLLFSVLGTGSRAALGVCLGVSLIFLGQLFFSNKKMFLYGLKYVAGFFVISSAAFVVVFIFLVMDGVLYGAGREQLWGLLLGYWLDQPVFGYGFGQSSELLLRSGIELSSHSAFVQLLVEGGFLGFSLFFVFVFSLFFGPGRDLDTGKVKYFALMVVFFVVVHQSFESLIFHFSPYSFVFFAFAGWISNGKSDFLNESV